ncbi:MAG TPA: squalene/phytoene synthase family protein [Vitreimonas sp.]|uniref:phytoene/squalene synthase family protein n=1 Tax=Vitreimonas sp. TaxID=3069702 RepID=UPI002D51F636|nr:squalene/phytoene synthase family protein [Vitreimonas sp.]HYD88394.1 squalene/phytoene synthase family protein [Vitreimonas sp.]
MDEDLDALVRRVDEDRWLASRFAPADARGRLIALYALNFELAHVAEIVKAPAVGDIRLAWWREALGEIHAGKRARLHPVLSEYALAHKRTPFPLVWLEALLDARGKDLDPAPFDTLDDLDSYIDGTAGMLMRLAAHTCGADAEALDGFIAPAGRAWGLCGLIRAEPVWRARGRRLLPRQGGTLDDLRRRAEAAYLEARAQPKPAPAAAPALNYVTLVPLYLSQLARERPSAPLLMRQIKVVAATATGRL